jgi:hypothetical protein
MRWLVTLALVIATAFGLVWLWDNVPDAKGWIILAFVVLLYFLPTTTAINGKHRQVTAIFVLNLFLGWTLIGWVIALVWAYVKPPLTPSANQ